MPPIYIGGIFLEGNDILRDSMFRPETFEAQFVPPADWPTKNSDIADFVNSFLVSELFYSNRDNIGLGWQLYDFFVSLILFHENQSTELSSDAFMSSELAKLATHIQAVDQLFWVTKALTSICVNVNVMNHQISHMDRWEAEVFPLNLAEQVTEILYELLPDLAPAVQLIYSQETNFNQRRQQMPIHDSLELDRGNGLGHYIADFIPGGHDLRLGSRNFVSEFNGSFQDAIWGFIDGNLSITDVLSAIDLATTKLKDDLKTNITQIAESVNAEITVGFESSVLFQEISRKVARLKQAVWDGYQQLQQS